MASNEVKAHPPQADKNCKLELSRIIEKWGFLGLILGVDVGFWGENGYWGVKIQWLGKTGKAKTFENV